MGPVSKVSLLRSGHVALAFQVLGRGEVVICDWGRGWVGCNFIGIVVHRKRFNDAMLLRKFAKETLLQRK